MCDEIDLPGIFVAELIAQFPASKHFDKLYRSDNTR